MPRVTRLAERAPPVDAVVQDARDVREGLDVVEQRRLAPEPHGAREGRLVARLAALTFDRVEDRRLLTADVRAGALSHLDVEREPLTEDVVAEEASLPCLGQRVLEDVMCARILAAQVDEAQARVDRQRRDGHAFEQRVGLASQQHPILEGAGLAFVCVAHDDPRTARRHRRRAGESPFAGGRKAGAASAAGEALVFLHADTFLPPDADRAVLEALASHAWGRFDVAIDSDDPRLAVIAYFMNRRSRLTGIATGDQAIFVRRSAFQHVGGFPDQPLMEDIEFSRRLRSGSAPACLRQQVITSGRRWERDGVWHTVVLMWWLRWRYRIGAAPERLARLYE